LGEARFSLRTHCTSRVPLPAAGLVHIFNRHGQQVCDVLLESRAQCIALEWDKDGEVGQRKTRHVAG